MKTAKKTVLVTDDANIHYLVPFPMQREHLERFVQRLALPFLRRTAKPAALRRNRLLSRQGRQYRSSISISHIEFVVE